MTYSKFKMIVWELRREFSRRTGSVAFCKGKSGSSVCVCCGCITNTGLLPTKCLVWAGDDLLYSGELYSRVLCRILTRRKLCMIKVTNIPEESEDSPSTCFCVGDFEGCRKYTCPCKRFAKERSNVK